MAITIPVPANVRVDYDYPPGIPGIADVNVAAPGPLSVAAPTVPHPSGLGSFTPSVGANNGAYIGFGLVPTQAGDAIGALRHTIVSGFAGVVRGSEVYLDATTGAMTHTATSNGKAIGIGYTTEQIFFY
jgi:hypothetical protein